MGVTILLTGEENVIGNVIGNLSGVRPKYMRGKYHDKT